MLALKYEKYENTSVKSHRVVSLLNVFREDEAFKDVSSSLKKG